MREYIYVSASKLDALAHLLPATSLARLRELNVSVGPIGGGIALSDASPPTRHQLVVEIERAIGDSRVVEDPRATHLAAGDWVAAQMRVVFGIPSDSLQGSAVVFLADVGDTALALCGSSVHLLSQVTAEGPVTGGMSAPGEIGRLLWLAAAGEDPASEREEDLMAGYAFRFLWDELRRWAPPQPVSFLARITHVFEPENASSSKRIVVGTPLYVAYELRTNPT